MSWKHWQNCDECHYIDRPIIIVGSRRFNTEMLANYICAHTPAKWQIVDNLAEIAPTASDSQDDWRLIFIDCLGLPITNIRSLVKKDAARLLTRDIIALLNLHREETDFLQLIDLGISGFFFEHDSAELIIKGICALKKGDLWVPRDTLLRYIAEQPRKVSPEKELAAQLTPREREVLHLLGTGLSNDKIASQLFISNHTVKSHIYKVLKKLDVENRIQAALWAAKHL